MASTAMTFVIDGSCARKTSDWPKDKMKIAAAAATAKLDFILQLGRNSTTAKCRRLNLPSACGSTS